MIRILFLTTAWMIQPAFGQRGSDHLLMPVDTVNLNRVWIAGGVAATSYTAFSIGLYQAWYRKNGLGKFHFFNDAGEWMHMDKAAHAFSGYFQSEWGYRGARWCGYSERAALLWGNSMAMLFQTTIEVMDGYGKDYGFSWPDMAANMIGLGIFTSQQLIWKEQKFRIKLSAWPQRYSSEPVNALEDPDYSIKDRTRELFGNGFFNTVFKDYNAQTYWLSFSPERMINRQWTIWPDWLNVAFGFGAGGLLGGYSNVWDRNNGIRYNASSIPRVNEYYLSLDIDLSKINTRNRFLKSLCSLFNIVKIPAPAVSLNSEGKWKGYWLRF